MDRSKFAEMMAQSKAATVISSGSGGGGGGGSATTTLVNEISADQPGPGMQFGFDVAEVQRVNLGPGDVLMVTVKNDDLSQESVDALRYQLQTVFPNNKVFIFAMGTSDDVKISVVSSTEAAYSGTGKTEETKTPQPEDDHMKRLAEQAEG